MIGLAFSGCRDEYERKRLLQNTKTATVSFVYLIILFIISILLPVYALPIKALEHIPHSRF